MYEIHDPVYGVTDGYRSEAEAVRAAMEDNPEAEIVWSPEKEVLGKARDLAKELEIR